jgi:hypothetical protein
MSARTISFTCEMIPGKAMFAIIKETSTILKRVICSPAIAVIETGFQIEQKNSSSFSPFTLSSAVTARSNGTPPPGKMP